MEGIERAILYLVIVIAAGIIYWDARLSSLRIDRIVAAIAFGSIVGAFVSATLDIFGG